MTAAATAGLAISFSLALDACLDVGQGQMPLAYGVPAVDAKTELVGGFVQAFERRQDPGQGLGAGVVALGGDDLVHLRQGLLVFVAAHLGRILAHGLYAEVAFAQDLGLERQEAGPVAFDFLGRHAGHYNRRAVAPAARKKRRVTASRAVLFGAGWACAGGPRTGRFAPMSSPAQIQPVLVAGKWRASDAAGTFQPDNPQTREPTGETYPVSSAQEVEEVIRASHRASLELKEVPAENIARFLETYADKIEGAKQALVDKAHGESALPKAPRLGEVELPRTTNQLRQAAAAAREGSWALPTIDTKAGIRSVYAALEGGVSVFGPNNFPFAFNSAVGGDFAAAIAAGNAVIAKGNTSHPGTTRLFGELALAAAAEVGLPAATVQVIYRTDHQTGKRLVADPLIAATGYTGARSAGLVLKEAADKAGKPIYLELSSINPVVVLPGAVRTRGDSLVDEFTGSCLMGTGQFCTNPGLVVLLAGAESDAFLAKVRDKFQAAPVGTLLGKSVEERLGHAVSVLSKAGAEVVAGGSAGGGRGYSFQNTLLKASGAQFLANPAAMQEEAFGNASLFVVAADVEQAAAVLGHLEGNLTGSLYTDAGGTDDATYAQLAPILRRKVGRLLNDKMPTGVAVSPAMNHGGPYPATGHPGFTAVGIPASLRRFAMLQCFDAVREARLPPLLRDKNPTGNTWRLIDGQWSLSSL